MLVNGIMHLVLGIFNPAFCLNWKIDSVSKGKRALSCFIDATARDLLAFPRASVCLPRDHG